MKYSMDGLNSEEPSSLGGNQFEISVCFGGFSGTANAIASKFRSVSRKFSKLGFDRRITWEKCQNA